MAKSILDAEIRINPLKTALKHYAVLKSEASLFVFQASLFTSVHYIFGNSSN